MQNLQARTWSRSHGRMMLTACFLLLCSYTTQDHLSEVAPPTVWVDLPTVVNLNCLQETGIYLLNKVEENIYQQEKRTKTGYRYILALQRQNQDIYIAMGRLVRELTYLIMETRSPMPGHLHTGDPGGLQPHSVKLQMPQNQENQGCNFQSRANAQDPGSLCYQQWSSKAKGGISTFNSRKSIHCSVFMFCLGSHPTSAHLH